MSFCGLPTSPTNGSYGILTTVNGWAFLKRENGWGLYMTELIDCTENTGGFAILKALYCMSQIARENGDLIETDVYGNAAVFKPDKLQIAVLNAQR
jgi:hypothetical protein